LPLVHVYVVCVPYLNCIHYNQIIKAWPQWLCQLYPLQSNYQGLAPMALLFIPIYSLFISV